LYKLWWQWQWYWCWRCEEIIYVWFWSPMVKVDGLKSLLCTCPIYVMILTQQDAKNKNKNKEVNWCLQDRV
jgi:hypothetical protein